MNNLSLLEDSKRQHKSIIPINYLGCGVTFHSKWKCLTKLLQSSYQHKQWAVQLAAGS